MGWDGIALGKWSLNGDEWILSGWTGVEKSKGDATGVGGSGGEGRQGGAERAGRGCVRRSPTASQRSRRESRMVLSQPLVSNDFSPHG